MYMDGEQISSCQLWLAGKSSKFSKFKTGCSFGTGIKAGKGLVWKCIECSFQFSFSRNKKRGWIPLEPWLQSKKAKCLKMQQITNPGKYSIEEDQEKMRPYH